VSILGRLFQRDGMAVYRRGILHFNKGEYREAIADFERTLEGIRDPEDPYYSLGRFYAAEAHAKLGLSYEGLGDLREAAEEFRRALACGYHYPDLHLHLAAIHDAAGDDAEAERECRTALEKNPDYLDARARLLITLANQGRREDAASELARLVDAGYPIPESIDRSDPRIDAATVEAFRVSVAERRRGGVRMIRALESYDRGDRETAIAELRSAVRDQPRYADLRCRLGTLLCESGRLREGLEEIEKAIELNGFYVEARLQAGIACLRLGAPEDALHHLRIAAEKGPEHPDVRLFLGLAFLRNGDFDEAGRILGAALDESPFFHRARYCLGLVRLAQGRTEEAIAMIAQASNSEAGLARARLDLGFIKVHHGDPEVAATLFREVLKKDPADGEARLGLGLALESSGRRGDARPEFLHVITADPRSLSALTALARIDLADGKCAEAGGWCDRAIEDSPKSPDLHVLRADAWRGIGDLERAKNSYEAALAIQPDHAEARVGLGLCLFRMKHGTAGRVEMESVFRADPANPIARVFADEKLIEGL
jgi:tetratricopeptide (TPR) repeat protein